MSMFHLCHHHPALITERNTILTRFKGAHSARWKASSWYWLTILTLLSSLLIIVLGCWCKDAALLLEWCWWYRALLNQETHWHHHINDHIPHHGSLSLEALGSCVPSKDHLVGCRNWKAAESPKCNTSITSKTSKGQCWKFELLA